MLEPICTYSLNSDITLSNSDSTIVIMGGIKSAVADDSGQWTWLTRPLRVTFTDDFWKSVTFWKTEKEFGSIDMKPVSLINALILFNCCSSILDFISGWGYPFSVTVYLISPSFFIKIISVFSEPVL